MNEAVMLSIRPQWVAKIISGEKTVEVRKTFPGMVTLPFKVYIYETAKRCGDFQGRGAVIGECMCDEIYDIEWNGEGYNRQYDKDLDCLSLLQMHDYLGTGSGYGWHLKDLKTYHRPVEVGAFTRICSGNGYIGQKKQFTKCPQSWSYCEPK